MMAARHGKGETEQFAIQVRESKSRAKKAQHPCPGRTGSIELGLGEMSPSPLLTRVIFLQLRYRPGDSSTVDASDSIVSVANELTASAGVVELTGRVIRGVGKSNVQRPTGSVRVPIDVEAGIAFVDGHLSIGSRRISDLHAIRGRLLGNRAAHHGSAVLSSFKANIV